MFVFVYVFNIGGIYCSNFEEPEGKVIVLNGIQRENGTVLVASRKGTETVAQSEVGSEWRELWHVRV